MHAERLPPSLGRQRDSANRGIFLEKTSDERRHSYVAERVFRYPRRVQERIDVAIMFLVSIPPRGQYDGQAPWVGQEMGEQVGQHVSEDACGARDP